MNFNDPSIKLVFEIATTDLLLFLVLEVLPHGKVLALSDHLGLLELVEVCHVKLFDLFRRTEL